MENTTNLLDIELLNELDKCLVYLYENRFTRVPDFTKKPLTCNMILPESYLNEQKIVCSVQKINFFEDNVVFKIINDKLFYTAHKMLEKRDYIDYKKIYGCEDANKCRHYVVEIYPSEPDFYNAAFKLNTTVITKPMFEYLKNLHEWDIWIIFELLFDQKGY